jgi:hypothetical protein
VEASAAGVAAALRSWEKSMSGGEMRVEGDWAEGSF